MSVTGLPNYAAVQDFKRAIGGLNRVKAVTPGNFGGGKAQFDVTYLGTTDDFADALGAVTRFKKKKLTVTGVTANTLEVVVAQ